MNPNPFHPKRCSHFLDSGAHSLTNLMFKKGKGRINGKINWKMYKTKEFWDYVDRYAEFVKKFKAGIDVYCNVDVIRNPALSWKVLKYLENEHGLHPLPVVHFNTPLKWIEKHIDAGYSYIGMGGPVGKIPYDPWADRAWNLICSTPTRIPQIKVHGFAVTTHKYITRYPWYSVDSVTSKKMGYFGQVLPPPLKNGRFRFDIPNLIVFIDSKSPYTNRGNGKGRHFLHMTRTEQNAIRKWFDYIHIPYGARHKDGSVEQEGVSNSIECRVAANITYFQHLAAAQPKWPWSFHREIRPTLGEAMGI